jgi:peptidoglycan/LPS O-acetylase OafA/YrhL
MLREVEADLLPSPPVVAAAARAGERSSRDSGTVPRADGEASGRRPRLGYRPGLDGIRALAVVAVFAYHANLRWARAGFLGVDVFFVLSGYLITALLLAERRRTGTINLRQFWGRRARRLLPAVVVLLAAVAVAIPLLAPDQSYRLRGDLVASLGYVMNWRLIFAHQSYFQSAGRPPILQHLWSLAVEEQFYLLWPPILALTLRRRPYRRLVKPLLIAAAASAGLMLLLFTPYTDPSRVYFGTDTRAAALLVGAALAAATTRWQLVDRVQRGGRVALDAVGFVCLAGLALAVSHVNEFDPLLYRGGFLVVAVLAAGLVAAAARPGPPLVVSRLLGSSPLVWLGKRSYAVYLWFWPVLMLTRPHADVPLMGLPLLALRIAITLALAAASYRFVERPAHHGALGRVWADVVRAWRTRTPLRRRSAAWGLAFSVVLTCVGIGVAVGHGTLRPTPVLAQAAGLNSSLVKKVGARTPELTKVATARPSTPAGTSATISATTPATASLVTTAPATTAPPTTTTTPSTTVPVSLPTLTAKVTAIGDSVLLGAQPLLEHQVDGIVVDASVGRQFSEVLSTAKSYRDGGKLGDEVIVQTGNNGPISAGQFDQLMEVFKGVRRVVVVNVKVDRAWQDPNNDVISSGVPHWSNAVLVDWHALASGHPEAFYDDGLHLTPAGIRLFTAAVLNAL